MGLGAVCSLSATLSAPATAGYTLENFKSVVFGRSRGTCGLSAAEEVCPVRERGPSDRYRREDCTPWGRVDRYRRETEPHTGQLRLLSFVLTLLACTV